MSGPPQPPQDPYPQPGPDGPNWSYPPGHPTPPASARFDPADPLISADFAGWWRRSTRLITSGWRPLLKLLLLSAAALVVVELPVVIAGDRAVEDVEEQFRRQDFQPDEIALSGPMVAFFIAGTVLLLALVAVGFLVMLAAVRLVVAVAGGGVASIGRALRGALPRLLPMIGWSVLGGLLAVVVLLACLLPVLYIAAVLMILPAVVVFERGNAMGRCFRLFHAELGTAAPRAVTVIGLFVAGEIAVPFVLAPVNALLGQIPAAEPVTAAAALGFVAGTGIALLLQNVVSIAIVLLLVPFMVTGYVGLRARREPITTDTLVWQLDAYPSVRPN